MKLFCCSFFLSLAFFYVPDKFLGSCYIFLFCFAYVLGYFSVGTLEQSYYLDWNCLFSCERVDLVLFHGCLNLFQCWKTYFIHKRKKKESSNSHMEFVFSARFLSSFLSSPYLMTFLFLIKDLIVCYLTYVCDGSIVLNYFVAVTLFLSSLVSFLCLTDLTFGVTRICLIVPLLYLCVTQI